VVGNESTDAIAKHAALHEYGHDKAFSHHHHLMAILSPTYTARRREKWDFSHHH